MPADDVFVSLHRYLSGEPNAGPMPPDLAAAPPCVSEMPATSGATPATANDDELLRDVRLFRARLADALCDAQGQLVRELTYAVLGRELQLADADVGAIAARILAEHPAALPVRLCVAPGEALACGVPLLTVVDATLAPGDAVLEFTNGSIDARLGVRLARILEAWT